MTYEMSQLTNIISLLFLFVFVFFFKQKTAYEVEYGFVGSEKGIRDRVGNI